MTDPQPLQRDYAVIVAGGRGQRMGGDVPKQFRLVGGEPVLMRTIRRFHAYDPQIGIIVVLPHDQQPYWQQLCHERHFAIAHTVVDGGATRFGSSRAGIAAIPDGATGVVAIHDGVRPFVSREVIGRCLAKARETGAAIPVLPVTDTLRFVSAGESHNVQRADYRSVQTPQAFTISLARQAFSQPDSPAFTDDASVVEASGHAVSMVEGNRENIKLTTPFDLIVAEALIAQE